jgi:hypothetical protein
MHTRAEKKRREAVRRMVWEDECDPVTMDDLMVQDFIHDFDVHTILRCHDYPDDDERGFY